MTDEQAPELFRIGGGIEVELHLRAAAGSRRCPARSLDDYSAGCVVLIRWRGQRGGNRGAFFAACYRRHGMIPWRRRRRGSRRASSSRSGYGAEGNHPAAARDGPHVQLIWVDSRARKIVLVVDDDPSTLVALAMLLKANGFDAAVASCACDRDARRRPRAGRDRHGPKHAGTERSGADGRDPRQRERPCRAPRLVCSLVAGVVRRAL